MHLVGAGVNDAGPYELFRLRTLERSMATATAPATTEQLRHIVEMAALAPSVHNTQPWRFTATSTGLRLDGDLNRQLGVLDPEGRQLRISCGAALYNARVAARAIGLDASVVLLPIGDRSAYLADLRLTVGRPATEQQVELATAVLHRHTHRSGFEDRTVTPDALDRLRRAAEAEGAALRVVTTEDDLLGLEVLLARADAVEERDARYREELRRWVRDNPASTDGMPAEALDVVAGSSLRQRDFGQVHPADLDGTTPKAERPSVVVLATEADGPHDWLLAGQALAALLLRAAEEGLQAQPLGQVTDSVASRVALQALLGMVGLPQLVLRIGYAGNQALTPRRPVDEILVDLTDS